MALNDYNPYDTSNPYRTNSYGTGMYGDTGAMTPASQQNAYSQSYGTSGGGGSRSTDPYAAFADAANSWGPRGVRGGYGGYDTQSPYDPGMWQQQPGYGSGGGGAQTQFPVIPIESPYTPPIVGRQPGHGLPTPTSPSRPGVTGTIGQPPPEQGPNRPGVTGTIGQPGSGAQTPYDTGGYIGPNVTPTGSSGLSGITGDSPSPTTPQSQPWGPGEYKFVPGYGWTASAEEYADAQRQVSQPQQQGQGQGGGGQQQGGTLITNGSADPMDLNGGTASTIPGSGSYTPSGVAPPAPVQFPTAPGATSTAPGLNGATTTPATSSAPTDLASQLRSYLAPEFQQEQSDLQRQLLATGAAQGDLNSGGFGNVVGKQQARLSADQGSRLSDYLTQASEAEKNRQLQTYQIDTNSAIARMNDETAQFGIKTNDDLQRYLNSSNNALAKYGIDKNDVLQRYIAIQQAHGQSSAALTAFNAAALQAATQQSIAAMNNKTAQQNSQNQYNLGVLGINADNYRSDSSNLLSYLNLLMQSNPQAPVPQIPGVVGYGP